MGINQPRKGINESEGNKSETNKKTPNNYFIGRKS
jgi:hypothetical protein